MRANERLVIDSRMRGEVYTSTHNLEMDEHLTRFTFLDSQFAGVEGHHRHWGGRRREGEEERGRRREGEEERGRRREGEEERGRRREGEEERGRRREGEEERGRKEEWTTY